MSPRLPVTVNRLPLRIRLAAAIERLPESQRLVLALRLMDGLSPIEAAGALQLTTGEVDSRFDLALESIADELGARSRRAA